jgi:glycosyltransferase involved in cell wall biosynthesis
VPEDKITVIHDGIDHSVFKPWHDESSPGCSPPYLLYVGSERPRKNLLVLLRAFSLLRKQGRPFDSLTLLKIGSPGRSPRFRKQTIKEASRLGIDRQIHFVDRMSDRELAGAYSNAVALVYPSLYEGFGLPIVEAMACGCPVVTSNVSSIPEIAGSAALLVDPNDAKGLAEALGSVILRQDLRASLRAKGLRRATEFSWDRTAEATFAVYQRIFSGVATDAASLKKETRARAFHVDVQHQSLTPPRTAESSGRTS